MWAFLKKNISFILYAFMKTLDCGFKIWTPSIKKSRLVENMVSTGMVKVSLHDRDLDAIAKYSHDLKQTAYQWIWQYM